MMEMCKDVPGEVLFRIGRGTNGRWFTAVPDGMDAIDCLDALHAMLSMICEAFLDNQPIDDIEALKQALLDVAVGTYKQYMPVPEMPLLHIAICRAVELKALLELLAHARKDRNDDIHESPTVAEDE